MRGRQRSKWKKKRNENEIRISQAITYRRFAPAVERKGGKRERESQQQKKKKK